MRRWLRLIIRRARANVSTDTPEWTEWQDSKQTLPPDLNAPDPSSLLLAIVDSFNRKGELFSGLEEVALKLIEHGPADRTGIIAWRGIHDDCVGSLERRITMERHGETWHPTRVEERELCWRGVSASGLCR